MKKYTSIDGYLERFSLLSLGKLKVRIHHILSADKTPYLHSHPFHYISIVLSGTYVEQILKDDKIVEKIHQRGAIILRSAHTFHRIKSASKCKTLFFALASKNRWSLRRHSKIIENEFKQPTKSGIYQRLINDEMLFCKFDEFWFIGSKDIECARQEQRLSIYQVKDWANTTL